MHEVSAANARSKPNWNHIVGKLPPLPAAGDCQSAHLVSCGLYTPQFAPGPGKSTADLMRDQGNCGLAAQSGSDEFEAEDKPAFVAGMAVAHGLLQFAQSQNVYANCMLAREEVPVDHQANAVVQPVTEAPLAPVAAARPTRAAEVREAEAEQAAEAWALVPRVLYHPDTPGRAERLYRHLCTAGDTSSCAMAAAYDPRLGALQPQVCHTEN